MTDTQTIKSVLTGLGVPSANIEEAIPILMGEESPWASKELVDMNTATRLLKISRWSISRAIRDGSLICVKIGRRVLFKPSDLEDFSNSMRRS